MKIDANSIRVGNVLEHEKKLWVVLKTMHTQPGKGGAYMQVEMKDIIHGTKTNIRFRSSETVEKAHLETRDLQYLSNYEQIEANLELIDKSLAPFLKEGMNLTVQFHDNKLISITLPEKIEEVVAECEPVTKGQTVSSSYKPAILENGVRVMVPPFINQGDKIIVNTTNLEYLERA